MSDFSHYYHRLISQHKGKPKLKKWLEALLETSDHDENLLVDAFDIEQAVGRQLDILGALVGRDRMLPFDPDRGSALMDDRTYRLVLKAKIVANYWDGTTDGLYDIWNTVFPDVALYMEDNQDMSINITVVGFPRDIPHNIITNHYVLPKPQGVRINYEFAEILPSTLYLGMALYTSGVTRLRMEV